MARRDLLFAAFYAGVCCLALSAGALAQESDQVDVKIYVQGTVITYTSNAAPDPYSVGLAAPPPDIFHMLSGETADGSSGTPMRVDFGAKGASLKTGDVVQTSITIQLSSEQADVLGVLGLGATLSSSSRRLLSEQHEAARRMVLDFHGTRRTLQEVTTLMDVLRALNLYRLEQVLASAEDPIVIGKKTDKDLFVINGQQQQISSLTFVFKSTRCGIAPKISAEKVKEFYYDNGDDAAIVATVERFYNVCSFNQMTFKRESNLVFDVDIPCVGTTAKYGLYNLKTGYANGYNLDREMYALVELAKEYLQKTDPALYKQWDSYRRKVMIFPFNWFAPTVSPWSTLSMMGCASNVDCVGWINQPVELPQLDTVLLTSTLGHNMGLSNSAALVCTSGGKCFKDMFGDMTDPMGSAWPIWFEKTLICHNAPQSYKAGWASPIAGGHISAFSDLTPGLLRDFVLPDMGLGKNNMIRLVVDTANPVVGDANSRPQQALFLSYRVRKVDWNVYGKYDSGLRPELSHRVWIHEYNQTADGKSAPISAPPTLLTSLSDQLTWVKGLEMLNTSYTQVFAGRGPLGGGVVVSIKSKNDVNATVTLCRFLRSTEANCQDGIDNDCDGLIDQNDPDCNPTLRPPPPSPPSPPLRPPPPPPPKSSPPPPRTLTAKRSPPRQREPRTPHVPRTPRVPRVPRAPRPPPRKQNK